MLEIYFIIAFSVSLILAVTGVYFSFMNCVRWRQIDLSTLKAKVFLDRSFLKCDFKFALIMVVLISAHIAMEYMELKEILPMSLYYVYYSLFPIILLILVMMQYRWYTLLHRKIAPMKK